MQFLVDAQLPPALARMLREHGHTAEHVTEIGRADAPDRVLWRYALEHDAVIVTKDEDFADMVATGHEAPPVVWVRIGNTRRAALLEQWVTGYDVATRAEKGRLRTGRARGPVRREHPLRQVQCAW